MTATKVQIGNRVIDTFYIADARYDPQANVTVIRGHKYLSLEGDTPDKVEPYLVITWANRVDEGYVEEFYGQPAVLVWAALKAMCGGSVE